MKNTGSIVRWWMAALVLITAGVLVLSGRVVLRSEWMRGVVLEKLRKVVANVGGPSYHLAIGQVHIDPLGGDLSIDDIRLEPDTVLLDSLSHGHGRFVLSIRAGRIAVNGLSYWRLLFKEEVRVNSVRIDSPDLGYTYASHRSSHAENTGKDTSEMEAIDRVRIGELVIVDGIGRLVDLTGRSPELRVGSFNVRANKLRYLLPKEGTEAEWEVARTEMEIRDLRSELPPLYDLSIAHIGLSHPQGLVGIDSLRYIPRVERTTTHEHLQEMTTIYGLDVERITLAQVDLYRAFAEQQVVVGATTVDGVVFDVFLDKSMPDALSHFMPLPVSSLRDIPIGVRLDTLRLTNAVMTYAERFTVPHGYGSMRLTDIDATLLNVSNDTLLAIADSSLRGTVDAKLFGSGALHAEYTAPLSSRIDAFKLDVMLTDMPLSAANSMSENLLLLRADSGWIASLKFGMKGNNDSAMGDFRLKYSDAWLRILDDEGGKRRFLTGLANAAVVRDSKDRPLAERTMSLRIARKKDRSLFNYIWGFTREGLTRTLLPGVLSDIQDGMMRRKERERVESQRERKKAARKSR